MISQLRIEGLPPKTTRGTIVRLLTQVGGIDRRKIGKIEVTGRSALVEVPQANGPKLAAALDGTQLDQRYLAVSWRDAAESAEADLEEDHFQRLARLLRLEAAQEDAQTLAAASNHSAFNIANALGAWLGGLVIAMGFGYASTGYVGAVLSLLGLGVFLVSVTVERREKAA